MSIPSVAVLPLNVPAWLIGLMAGFWALLVSWMLVGQRWFVSSQVLRHASHVMAAQKEEEAVVSPLRAQLLEAGLDWSEMTYHMIRAGLALGGLLVGEAMGLPPLLIGLLLLAGVFGPGYYVSSRREARAQAMERELPIALSRIAGILRLQPDVAQVLRQTAAMMASAGPTPLSQELERAAAGVSTRGVEALRELERRSPSPGLSNLAFALRIYAETGGEFASIMADTAVRARRIVEGRNKAYAKAGKASSASKLIPLVALGTLIFAAQDPEMGAFYRSGTGQILIGVAVLLMGYGYLFIKRAAEEVL